MVPKGQGGSPCFSPKAQDPMIPSGAYAPRLVGDGGGSEMRGVFAKPGRGVAAGEGRQF